MRVPDWYIESDPMHVEVAGIQCESKEDYYNICERVSAGVRDVAIVTGNLADARAIAKVPEMVALLKDIVGYGPSAEVYFGAIDERVAWGNPFYDKARALLEEIEKEKTDEV